MLICSLLSAVQSMIAWMLGDRLITGTFLIFNSGKRSWREARFIRRRFIQRTEPSSMRFPPASSLPRRITTALCVSASYGVTNKLTAPLLLQSDKSPAASRSHKKINKKKTLHFEAISLEWSLKPPWKMNERCWEFLVITVSITCVINVRLWRTAQVFYWGGLFCPCGSFFLVSI